MTVRVSLLSALFGGAEKAVEIRIHNVILLCVRYETVDLGC